MVYIGMDLGVEMLVFVGTVVVLNVFIQSLVRGGF